jgi:hypothetical protein
LLRHALLWRITLLLLRVSLLRIALLRISLLGVAGACRRIRGQRLLVVLRAAREHGNRNNYGAKAAKSSNDTHEQSPSLLDSAGKSYKPHPLTVNWFRESLQRLTWLGFGPKLSLSLERADRLV